MKRINTKRWWPIKEKSLKLCILQANILLELEIMKRTSLVLCIVIGETYPVAFLGQCLGVCSPPHTSYGTLVAVLKEKERILSKERPRCALLFHWSCKGPGKHLHRMVLSLCPTNLQVLRSEFGPLGIPVPCALTVVLILTVSSFPS